MMRMTEIYLQGPAAFWDRRSCVLNHLAAIGRWIRLMGLRPERKPPPNASQQCWLPSG